MSEPGALPRSFKLVTLWLVLGTLLFLGVQWMMAQSQRTRFSLDGGTIELTRSRDGHFHWPGTVNGVAVDFLVDTGATRTALPQAVARRAEVAIHGSMRSDTAGGEVRAEVGTARIALDGGIIAERLTVAVLPALHTPLLGMDVLGRLRLTQSDGVLRIQPPTESSR
jgi:aspartyl protease family protein